jgi:MFS family permease
VPLWLLVAVNACNGAISAFDSPARTALISEMVPQIQWMEAQQLYSASSNITNIFGPALGGVLLSIGTSNRSHEEVAFFFNVLSFLPLLILITFLPSPRAATHAARSKGESFLRSVAEGLQFVRVQWSLRSLLQLLAVVMLLGMPFQTLLPIFVHGHPSMGGRQSHGYYAALLSAVALGGFVGGVAGDGLQQRPPARWLVVGCSCGAWPVDRAAGLQCRDPLGFAGGVLCWSLRRIGRESRYGFGGGVHAGCPAGAGGGDCQLEQGVAVVQRGTGQWTNAWSCAAYGCAWIGLLAGAGVDGVVLILVVLLLRGPLLALEARAASASA